MKTNGRQRDWEGPSVMTNYEKIKGMSVEEMAEWMAGFDGSGMCNYCDRDSTWPMIADYGCELGDGAEVCAGGIKRWLQHEAEE